MTNKGKLVISLVVTLIVVFSFNKIIDAFAIVPLTSNIDVEDFYKDNNMYSKMNVQVVKEFKNKDKETNKGVLLVNFNAFYKGDYVHIVTCKSGDCSKPENRTATPLENLSKAEQKYYNDLLEK